jgi:hypothetical protein
MAQPDLTPLDLSDEDLDRLSEITEQDIVIANRFITKQLDPEFKNLILAVSQELADLENDNG